MKNKHPSCIDPLWVSLLLAVFLSACSPVGPGLGSSEQEKKPSEPSAQAPSAQKTGSQSTAARSTGAQHQTTLPQEEPDWRERYQKLRLQLMDAFTHPTVGAEMVIVLLNGSPKKGILREVSPDGIVMRFDDAVVNYPKESLSPETRMLLIQEDFISYHANWKLKEEKATWRQAQKKARADLALARLDSIKETARFDVPPPPEPPKPKPKPLLEILAGPPANDPKDASVRQVRNYIAKNTRNAESVRYLEWSRVVPHSDGYSVRCSFEVYTDSFGRITENKVYYMNKAGRVVNVAGGTQAVRKLDL